MPPKKSASSGSSGKKAPVKRKLAEEFPPGEVLTDTAKRQWKLGPPAGQGGFGRLYLANENSLKAVEQDAPYVIKVEPIENGPLFSELKFYMRVAKADMIQNWVNIHNLDYLGVPRYWGSGIHKKSGSSYRFMVMDRFGKDLQKVLVDCGKRFPHKTVLQLGLRLIDILEYIHEHEYVHGDIKASNILLDYKHPDQVFLVDYGLCYRYCVDGVHKEYKEDPRRCHNGTIEFTSVDAHKGVNPSRRGDLEILGYCMIQWLCGKLPWEDNLMDPNYVSNSKIRYCDEVPMLMDTCFPGKKKPAELRKYMMEITQLAYDAKPSYDKLRDILLQGLKALGGKKDGKLDFPVTQNGHSPAKDRKVQGSPGQSSSEDGSRTNSNLTVSAAMSYLCPSCRSEAKVPGSPGQSSSEDGSGTNSNLTVSAAMSYQCPSCKSEAKMQGSWGQSSSEDESGTNSNLTVAATRSYLCPGCKREVKVQGSPGQSSSEDGSGTNSNLTVAAANSYLCPGCKREVKVQGSPGQSSSEDGSGTNSNLTVAAAMSCQCPSCKSEAKVQGSPGQSSSEDRSGTNSNLTVAAASSHHGPECKSEAKQQRTCDKNKTNQHERSIVKKQPQSITSSSFDARPRTDPLKRKTRTGSTKRKTTGPIRPKTEAKERWH